MSEYNYDIEHAKLFLQVIDPEASEFCFQFFRKTKKGDSEKPPVLSSLQHIERIAATNQQYGFNVAITVSKTNGASRKLNSITQIRAAFIDFDSKLIGKTIKYADGLEKVVEPLDLEALKNSSFPPHMIVESSPGNYHAYWALNDLDVLNSEAEREVKSVQYSEIQKRLAYLYGADPGCTGINWSMCVPGFWRFKEDEDDRPPSLITLVQKSTSEIRYVPSYFLDSLRKITSPAKKGSESKPKKKDGLSDFDEDTDKEIAEQPNYGNEESRKRARKWLLDIAETLASMHEGGRDTLLNEICWTMGGYIASGALEEQDSKAIIRKAAEESGLDENRIRDKLTRVVNQGKHKPIVIDPRIINMNKPRTVGQTFLDSYHTWRKDGKAIRTLHFWRGDFWFFMDGHYKELPIEMLRSQLAEWLSGMLRKIKDGDAWKEVPLHPKLSNVDEVLGHLKLLCALHPTVDSNSWISFTKDEIPAGRIVPFVNGLYDTRSCELMPCNPLYFNLSACSQTYSPHVEEPVEFLKFLEQIFVLQTDSGITDEPDIDQIALLQEWFGYVLTNDTSRHKMMVLIGPTRGGKGTIEAVMRGMLGRDTVGSFDFATMSTDHGLEPLINKSLIVCSDFREQGVNKGRIVSTLLGIVANDAMSINPKGKKIVNAPLNTKLMLCSNDLPSFRDPSGAMFARLLFLETRRSFLGREDRGLVGRLLKELQSITMWALRGLRALDDSGDFTCPPSVEHVRKEVRDSDSPLFGFVSEQLVFADDYTVGLTEIYDAYKDWCEVNGHTYRWTAQMFHRNIMQLYGGRLRKRQQAPRADNNYSRATYYMGAALIEDKEKVAFPKGAGRDIPF